MCGRIRTARRNGLATEAAGTTDPVQVAADSVRLVAREMMTDPMWHWWLKRTDLMVERMRVGFRPYGMRDNCRAIEAGGFHIAGDDRETAWSFLIWHLAGSITDIVDGHRPAETEQLMAETAMQITGVDIETAKAVSRAPLPEHPPLEIDFSFISEDCGTSRSASRQQASVND